MKDPHVDLKDIPDFPNRAKEILDTEFARLTSTCKSVKRSDNGETSKLLISLQDGNSVEAVIMKYDTSLRDETGQTGHARYTLCVSSEVGCQMGCTFCATGAYDTYR